MPEFPPPAQALLARQDNVITRAQLLQHGLSYPTIRWNAGRGWRVVLPHVFCVARERPTTRQRQIAALLWAGPGSVLAGATAARLHGATSADPLSTVHVLVPAPRGSRTSGFAEVRRTLLHDAGTVTRGPCSSRHPRGQRWMPLEPRAPTTRGPPSSSNPSSAASRPWMTSRTG